MSIILPHFKICTMSQNKCLLFILLFLLIIQQAPAQQAFSSGPSWLKQAVFYQVYPQSFKDSDGDGIGDLNGVASKLDYLQWLGINAIWMNPIFESPFFDAGYDVSDFYKIAPRYGSNDDLKLLIDKAHKKNIKLVFDLVAGHTSDQHDWFKASAQKKKNIYTDRYIWTNNGKQKPTNFVSGNFKRNGNYLKNFFDCQPALNYGYVNPNPANKWEQAITAPGPVKMKAELQNIIAFWMDKGIDGFRVDMASSLIKNDKGFASTMQLWAGLRTWFERAYPQGVLIAEWSNPKLAIKAGFMIDFMMHFNVPGYPSLFFNKGGVFTRDTCYFDLAANGSPHEFINNYLTEINSVGNAGYVSVPTANHDINRLNSGSRNTDDQLKVALAFLFTLKGIPFIYYGDEIGMRYVEGTPGKEGSILTNYNNVNRAGSRTPMQWDNSHAAGFSTAESSRLYLPVDTAAIFPTVAAEQSNPSSLLSFTKNLLALRKTRAALGNEGSIEFLNKKDQHYPLLYLRKSGMEEYLIVINPGGRQASILLDAIIAKSFEPVLVDKVSCTNEVTGTRIIADQVTYGIYKLNR